MPPDEVKPRADEVRRTAETAKAETAPSAEPAPRRNGRGESRRSALLAAAREMFLERGYERASVDDVMRRVGGSKASLYRYFGSKEGLFWEFLSEECERFLRDLDVPDHADADLGATLTRIGRKFLCACLHPDASALYRLVIAEADRFPELAQRFYETGPLRTRRVLGRYLQAQTAAGRLRCSDPELTAALFLEMLKSLPVLQATLGLPAFTAERSAETHVSQVVALFLHGCATAPLPNAAPAVTAPSRTP